MFTVKEIIEATGGKLIKGNRNLKVSGISIDSRSIRPGELFLAIQGQRFNGHSFIAQACRRGAKAIMFCEMSSVDRRPFERTSTIALIRVKDTIYALGALARYHRLRFKIPIIAITGSNGKTTTKDMISATLSAKFKVLSNPGTQNNHIGVPMTVLRLNKGYNLAVIEIGANHPGEIDRLSWIIQPSVGIITNIGPAHLEFFQTLKGVFKAKSELIRNLTKRGKLIINKDDRFLSRLNGLTLRTVTFGFNRFSNFYAQSVEQTDKGVGFLLNGRHKVLLQTLGRHNVYNALASVACARSFGINFSQIKKALASFQPPLMRMQMLNIDNIRIINDCYNSNPESLRCALDFLKQCSTEGDRIVVCADMLELGRLKEQLHRDIGKRIAQDKINFLIVAGNCAKHIAAGAVSFGMPESAIYICRNSFAAAKILRKIAHPGDSVLIKGSRAMKMERIIQCFTNSFIH